MVNEWFVYNTMTFPTCFHLSIFTQVTVKNFQRVAIKDSQQQHTVVHVA